MSNERAGKDYWDAVETNRLPRVFNPAGKGLRQHAQREWDRFFAKWLAGVPPGGKLLELGCGGSVLLPYLRRRFGLEVAGIDYSQPGCLLAQQICSAQQCAADIICGDVFDPPDRMLSRYDVVVSFGLAEHFNDTAAAIRGFSRYLAPGGTMITTVPNMAGLPGTLQRLFSAEVFERHVALDAVTLAHAHTAAGLTVLAYGYLQAVNFGVVNPGAKHGTFRRAAFAGLRALTAVVWAAEQLIGSFPTNRLTSPYAYCVATIEQRYAPQQSGK
jgi:2-polyprenyl-3-methyl-5-hydroxy-6-metoxy-1,4-benzoquinol methylase